MPIRFFYLALFALLLSGCSSQPATPLSVSEAFWQAVQKKDLNAIEALSLPNSLPEKLEESNVVSISGASFGKIIIDGAQAEVETRITIESDEPLALPIRTLLVQEEDGWKVDYRATVSAVSMQNPLNDLLRELKVFGEEFGRQFDQSMDQLDEAMPEIQREIGRMGETFKERVPELKQQFEGLAEELQKAIEEAFDDPQFQNEDPSGAPEEESKSI